MKLSKRERVVLEVLNATNEKLRGSQIVANSSGRIGRGTIYTVLDHLIDAGMVCEEWRLIDVASQFDEPQECVHFITDAGREALKVAA